MKETFHMRDPGQTSGGFDHGETPRKLADQALSRATGTELIDGNRVRLLKDGSQNYPAWLQAISSATKWIHFETYIIHEDEVGRKFAEVLSVKAHEGVSVRLIYDWWGSINSTSRGYYRRLAQAGVQVRCYNRFNLESPLAWMGRDHRKMIAVDGRVAYVAGLCVGQSWLGFSERQIGPWRDTGIEIQGPAIAEIERAFADTWAATGDSLSTEELPLRESLSPLGQVPLRVVAGISNSGGVYRLDQVIATLARKSIWLADAYFLGTGAYIQSLQSAARSGVDVRLLIPGANDVPVVRALSRAGLRPLLEAGVRVFEWDGSMMHAKTAVADGRWARVGSTNLNLTSWLANRELDVVIEDQQFAQQMEQMYEEDLAGSTEIVLYKKRPRTMPVTETVLQPRGKRAGGPARTAAGVMRISQSLAASVTNRRELGPAEAIIMLWGAIFLAGVSAIAAKWPRAVAIPVIFVCVWTALSFLVRAYKLRFQDKKRSEVD